MNEILDAPGVGGELYTRINRLASAWEATFGDNLLTAPMLDRTPSMIASLWTAELQGRRGPGAGLVVATLVQVHLVEQAESGSHTFWGSPLGRAVAWWTGGPEGASASVLAALLGTSRQRIYELRNLGRLTNPAQVREEMRGRWPLEES